MTKEATFENALSFAQDLIRLPSPSGEEEAVVRRVAEEMDALGFTRVTVDEVGNVFGVIPGTGHAPSVLLNSHVDVVAVGDEAEWEHPPYAGLVEGGSLHGRGAMDIKGPLALQTHAAAMLKGRTEGDVIVAHTVLEERGGWGMEHLMAQGAVKPDAIIIGEATHGDVCTGHRGRGEVLVTIHGEAGHASAPARARNALNLLGPVLSALDDLAGSQPSDPILGQASLVPTDVLAKPTSRNVIPDHVTVVIDWRVLPGSTNEDLLAAVHEAIARRIPVVPEGYRIDVHMAEEAQRTHTGIERIKPMFTPGFLMAEDHPVVRQAARAVGKRVGAGDATTRPWTFATDGGWSCGVHGVPTIGFAPGEERYAHTNRERLDLDEARWALSRYPDLIIAVQGAL